MLGATLQKKLSITESGREPYSAADHKKELEAARTRTAKLRAENNALESVSNPRWQKYLQELISSDTLKNSKTLQSFAYSYPERNGLMSVAAHNDTANFLIEEFQELGDYYTVERQP